jgi:hypothetical protein
MEAVSAGPAAASPEEASVVVDDAASVVAAPASADWVCALTERA